MSRDWNSVVKLSSGIGLVVAVVTCPLPGRSVENQPLKVGGMVSIPHDCSDRPWKILAVNHPQETVVLIRGDDRAVMASWECVPVE